MSATNIEEGEVIPLKISELDPYIQEAFSKCQIEIDNNPNQIFSEADFERLLARILEEKLSGSNWSVHTQLANYYDEDTGDDETIYKEKRDKAKLKTTKQETAKLKTTKRKYKRPDIALLKHECFKYDRKKAIYVYKSSSIVFELKYRHNLKKTDKGIKDDFKKAPIIGARSKLYVVVLADTENNDDFEKKKGYLEGIKESAVSLDSLNENQKNKCKKTKCFLIEKRIPKSEEHKNKKSNKKQAKK